MLKKKEKFVNENVPPFGLCCVTWAGGTHPAVEPLLPVLPGSL